MRTPLFDLHVKQGAKMVDFFGWEMPVQYEGIIAEHKAVRQAAGLFDVSHMGEIFLRGPNALAMAQNLVTNDISQMNGGEVHYSPMCNERGGCVDDVLVYKMDEQEYLIVVNASNADKDFAWMLDHAMPGVTVTNASGEYAQIALQGPKSLEIIQKVMDAQCIPSRYYSFVQTTVLGSRAIVSRTGYTGEDGFELYVAPEASPALWERLLEEGHGLGLVPVGLGARDTLRLEAAMPLYGHELTDDISPLEAGLSRFVRLEKPDFIGKAALAAQKAQGLTRKRCGLGILDRGIAREGAEIFKDGRKIGAVTSGTMAPWLNKSIAMAMLQADQTVIGSKVEIEVRGRRLQAEVVRLPFYKRAEGK